MKHCFVMQPFDGGQFDMRFNEIIEPVVTECGFIAYRVDRDLSADILIDSIERMISISEFCIAEITKNNPNVWYELGYAYAKGKQVILVCSDERGDKGFPFDIRHRNILVYAAKAPSDFETYKKNLKQRIQMLVPDRIKCELSDLEKIILNYVYNNLNTENEVIPKEKIRVSSKEDITYALKRLVNYKYLEYIYSVDDASVHSNYYRVTEKGLSVIKGQERYTG